MIRVICGEGLEDLRLCADPECAFRELSEDALCSLLGCQALAEVPVELLAKRFTGQAAG